MRVKWEVRRAFIGWWLMREGIDETSTHRWSWDLSLESIVSFARWKCNQQCDKFGEPSQLVVIDDNGNARYTWKYCL